MALIIMTFRIMPFNVMSHSVKTLRAITLSKMMPNLKIISILTPRIMALCIMT
jgi:hypothetical protein